MDAGNRRLQSAVNPMWSVVVSLEVQRQQVQGNQATFAPVISNPHKGQRGVLWDIPSLGAAEGKAPCCWNWSAIGNELRTAKCGSCAGKVGATGQYSLGSQTIKKMKVVL